ncbi:MAG: TlpA family protein disulfide reductase [Promethearchaeota archaeon]|jgi:thiol-disulfide isomerase/thioredoxin
MDRKEVLKRKSTLGLIFIGAVLISMVIGITYGVLNSKDQEIPANYTFETIEGDTIDLADHHDKVIILYFHFLGCTFCKITTPYLAAIEDDYSNNTLYIITITIDILDSKAALNNWRSAHNATWEIVRDDIDHSISSRFDISITPTTIIFDKNGALAVKILGSINFDNNVRSEINSHL